MIETIAFPIHGMTCTSCASRVTRTLRRLDGVTSVRVDLATDSATVTYEPTRASAEDIEAAVMAAGYEPELEAVQRVGDRSVAAEHGSLHPRRTLPRLVVAVAGIGLLGILVVAGVPLGSLGPLVAMAGCLGMHLLMGRAEHRH